MPKVVTGGIQSAQPIYRVFVLKIKPFNRESEIYIVMVAQAKGLHIMRFLPIDRTLTGRIRLCSLDSDVNFIRSVKCVLVIINKNGLPPTILNFCQWGTRSIHNHWIILSRKASFGDRIFRFQVPCPGHPRSIRGACRWLQ